MNLSILISGVEYVDDVDLYNYVYIDGNIVCYII